MLWLLLACDPVIVEVTFEAELEGIDGLPWGLTADQLGAPATGSFWYDATTGDQSGEDEHYGLFNSGGLGGFTLELEGVVFEGSDSPAIEAWDTTAAHWYFVHGYDPPLLGISVEAQTGSMSVDGVEDAALVLTLGFIDDDGQSLADDGLPDPFPFEAEDERGLSLMAGGQGIWLELTSLE